MSAEADPPQRPAAGKFEAVLDAVERAAAGILDEAEAEARRRIDEAESEAKRLASKRVAEVTRRTDAMMAHANEVSQRAQALLEALDAATRELGTKPDFDDVPGETGDPSSPADAEARPDPEPGENAEVMEKGQNEPESDAEPGSGETPEREPLRSLRERFNRIGRPPKTATRAEPGEAVTERADASSGRTRLRPSSPVAGKASQGAVLLATQMAVAGGNREQIEARLRNDFGIEDPGPILDGLIY